MRENIENNGAFPYDISDVLGEPTYIELECPGIYYYTSGGIDGAFPREWYIVEKDTASASAEAKRYGEPLAGHPELLSVEIGIEGSGAGVLQYEIARYHTKEKSDADAVVQLRELAAYGAEDYPEYFGAYPAPTVTPFGSTTRYKALTNGVFLLDTDQTEGILAVSYPIWDFAISTFTQKQGQRDSSRSAGEEKYRGPLFFSRPASCLALFELLIVKKEMTDSDLLDPAALCNAIWKHYPQYAIKHNGEEQLGRYSFFKYVMRDAEIPDEIEDASKFMIPLIDGAGTEYILF